MPDLGHRQNLSQRTEQRLTPALVHLVRLLTMNKTELVEEIQKELTENPVLEEGEMIAQEAEPVERPDPPDTEVGAASVDPASPAGADREDEGYAEIRQEIPDATPDSVPAESAESSMDDDPYRDFELGRFESYLNDGATRPRDTEVFERPTYEAFRSKPVTLTDHLEWQLGMEVLDDRVRDACHWIIGNLNEDGYLIDEVGGKEEPLSLEQLALDSGHTVDELQAALEVVQRFDPIGVAARNPQECLLLQLKHLNEDDSLAYEIVRDHLPKVQNKQFKEIVKAVNRPLDEVMSEVQFIRALDGRPGLKYNKSEARLIEPDVFIYKDSNGFVIVTNEDEVPQLRLSATYRRLVERNGLSKDDKEAKNYVREHFKSAVQLLRNLEQRKNIIVRVCEAIVKRQPEFLEKGIDQLKPMMIKDVAEEVGVHPSTVSRAVANKYAHTPQGVYELRYFFTEAVNGPVGASTSLLTVKRKVKKYIDAEDPKSPLTDDRIAQMLKEEGITVTRRSVTKYREDLKIPSTHQRRVRPD